MALLQSLKVRSFAFVWVGQSISVLGDRLFRIALLWWVLQTTGSGEAAGILAVCTVAPMVVFLLVGGVMVDRMPRVQVMIISDLARGVLTTVIAVLVYTDRLEMPIVYGVTIAFGFVDAFFQPAYSALIAEIIPRDDLPSANSLTILSWQLAGIVGPSLGAVLVGTGETTLAFTINAVSFFVSAVTLLGVPKTPPLSPAASRPNALRELREGVGVVIGAPWLWVTMLYWGILNAIDSGLYNVSLPFLIKDTLHLDIKSLGLVQSAASIGAVIAALWLGRRGRVRHRGLALYSMGLIVAACFVAMGLSPTIYLIAVAALVRGVWINSIYLVWTESTQSTVPLDKLGRVASIDEFIHSTMMSVAFIITGWATDHTDPSGVFLFGAIAIGAMTVLALLHPRIRRFD